METPLVSISIPTYNGLDFLKNCSIPSILNQTHKNFEVFIVNDGEDLRVKELVESINDPRFKYFSYERHEYGSKQEAWAVGGAVGQNIALDLASGKYMAHLDQDDLWSPFFLTYKLNYLEKNPSIEFIHSNCVYSSGNLVYGAQYKGSKIHNTIGHLTVFYRNHLNKYKYITNGKDPSDFNRWQRMYDDGINMKYLNVTDTIYNDKKVTFNDIRKLYFSLFNKQLKIIP